MPILPDFAAAEFTSGAPVDNPFYPLEPGTIRSYAGSNIDEETGETTSESNDFFVTFESKEILGIETIVVRDTAYDDGVLVEDTLDWFAQDNEGNVWYFGEIAYNYRYDDDGTYVSTDTDGSWTGGVDGAQPGWVMRAVPSFGAGYYQEFAPGVAVDEGIVVGIGEEVGIGYGDFTGVLKTLDTSALEPDVAEFKYYAPGVGQILADEGLDEKGEPELQVELQGIREVDAPADAIDLIGGEGSVVTFLVEQAGLDNAVGAYTFDRATGEIGEGRILFSATDGIAAGTSVSLEVESGQGVGLFLVADGANLGINLADYSRGGLHFRNILTGSPATLDDDLAPLVSDADGVFLPIQPLHALGNADGFNFLNPVAGVQAVELDAEPFTRRDDLTAFGFEDLRASEAGYDGDFNDVLVALSDTALSAGLVRRLVDGLHTSADQDELLA